MKAGKFEGHNSAAARITENNGNYYLISYATMVAELTREGWLRVNGLYTRTTKKHIGWFMHELNSTYQFAKQLVFDNMEYNINTGEYRCAG